MRTSLPLQFKIKDPNPPDHPDGRYTIPHPKIRDYYYFIIFSTGEGWEHLSVSIRCIVSRTKKLSREVDRTPTWAEMCWLKDLFWAEDECVVQYHPPKAVHISNHNYVLHIWKPIEEKLPAPPSNLVGALHWDKLLAALHELVPELAKEEAMQITFAYANHVKLGKFPESEDDIKVLAQNIHDYVCTEIRKESTL